MKKNLIAILSMAYAMSIMALPIDKDAARGTAAAFFAAQGKNLTEAKNVFRAPRNNKKLNAAPAYYVFNAENNGGFVIVSGDDRTAEILGYTDNGTFDSNNMPENMRSMLQYYADQIQWLDDNNIQITEESKRAAAKKRAMQARHSIAPLVTCKWNQGEPYNLMCPKYYDEQGNEHAHSATGCVATALAQVIYFYKHPAATTGRIPALQNSYNNGAQKVVLPAIKTGTAIDWDNMLDTYNGSETEEQKMAVANLMLIVGQSVKMGYGASSGSSYAESPTMFTKYLGFDNSMYVAHHKDYSIDAWFNLIYDELAKGKPVAFGGSSSGGGHAFVIDGFDGKDLFHLNWGWGGMNDGYFRITVLNPDDNSGIGASSSSDGYTMGQDAVIDLYPGEDGLPGHVDNKEIVHASINDTKVEGTTIISNYVNWTGSYNTFQCAVVMKNDEGELETITDIKDFSLSANTFVGQSFDLRGCFDAPGVYKVSPANKLKSGSEWYTLYNMKNDWLEAVVDENLDVTLRGHECPVKAIGWEYPGNLVEGKEQEVIITLNNSGITADDEFNQEVHFFASQDPNDKGKRVCHSWIGVKAGDTKTFAFYFKPETKGKWYLWLTRDGAGQQVIGTTECEIFDEAHAKKDYLYVSSKVVSNNGYGNFLDGYVTIKNQGKEAFSGKIKFILGWENNGWWVGGSKAAGVTLAPGESANVPFYYDNLEFGRKYRIAVAYSYGGDVSNGGLFAGNEWTIKPGAVMWNGSGTVSGLSCNTTFKASNGASAYLYSGTVPTTVTLGTNPNTLFCVPTGMQTPNGLDGANVVEGQHAKSINLYNTSSFYCPVNFTAEKATFSFTVTRASDGRSGWETFTLPFAATRATIDGEEVHWTTDDTKGAFTLREFAELDDDNKIVFANAKTLRGNTPYVIASPEELVGKTIVFEGENVPFVNTGGDNMIISTGIYDHHATLYQERTRFFYMLNDTGDAFDYVDKTTNTSLKAFTTYFTTKLDENERLASIEIAPATFVPGDANGDGMISVADLTLVANYILSGNGDLNVLASDVNGDGSISVADLTLIASQILGK